MDDPDAILSEMRELVGRTYTPDIGVRIPHREDYDRLVELFEELDALGIEGLIPSAWRRGESA